MMENGRRKAAGCPRGRSPLPEATRGRRTGRWLPVGSRMRLGTCLGRVGGEGVDAAGCPRGRGQLPEAARGCCDGRQLPAWPCGHPGMLGRVMGVGSVGS